MFSWIICCCFWNYSQERSFFYLLLLFNMFVSPVGWGCRIHQLHLCRWVRPPPYKFPGYETKQSDGEAPLMVELWGLRSNPSVQSLPSPLWPGVVASDRVRSIGQVELNCVLTLNWIVWKRTVLIFKLHTYAKLNVLKYNYFDI